MRSRALLAIAVTGVVLASSWSVPHADAAGGYQPPVDAEIVDPFRPPAGPYGAGNRGVDYATPAGTEVRAANDGMVTFAGQVGGTLHVVIEHADGVLTSYSFLASISVRAGQAVQRGEPLGTAADTFHFGARVAGEYIDPTSLFDQVFVVRLVPTETPTGAERAAAVRMVADALSDRGPGRAALDRLGERAGGAADLAVDTLTALGNVDDALTLLRIAAHFVDEYNPVTVMTEIAQVTQRWWEQRDGCTSRARFDELMAAGPPANDRVVVVIAGLGSSSGEIDAVERLDLAGLGYAPENVVVFSYDGGAAEPNQLGIPVHEYDPDQTTRDLHESGARLRDLLAAIETVRPGSEVDIIAHSQGGLVARAGLADYSDADPALADVAHLVTLGTPHQGSNLATGLQLFSASGGEPWLDVADLLAEWTVGFSHDDGPSIAQMSEVSTFVDELRAAGPPPDVDTTSIGFRFDWVVTSPDTDVPGATNVVVDGGPALDPHAAGVVSEAARREVLQAVNGLGPSCQSLGDMLVDYGVGKAIGFGEDALATGLVAARWRSGVRSG